MTKTFDLALARSLILRGHSVGSIAKKMKMSAARLYWEMSNAGVPVGDLKAARREAIAKDIAAGMEVAEVQRKYGSSRGYTDAIRREVEKSEKLGVD